MNGFIVCLFVMCRRLGSIFFDALINFVHESVTHFVRKGRVILPRLRACRARAYLSIALRPAHPHPWQTAPSFSNPAKGGDAKCVPQLHRVTAAAPRIKTAVCRLPSVVRCLPATSPYAPRSTLNAPRPAPAPPGPGTSLRTGGISRRG